MNWIKSLLAASCSKSLDIANSSSSFNPVYKQKANQPYVMQLESAPKFRTLFNMKLVSDAYLLSQPGLSFQGSKGELQMAFSSDKAVTPRDEPNVGVRETIASEGGVAPVARSTPVVLQPLGDPLVEDTLPSGTPDEDCLKMSLRNQDGESVK